MAAMRKAMDDAVADLQAALKLDPKCKPAMIELMYAQKGNHDAVNRMGAQALATDPTDDMIYYVWMGAASPLWAGSAQTRAAERRIAILDAAQRYRDRYPLMAVVETRKRLFDHLRDPNATEILDKAPDLRAIEAAVNAGVEEPLAYATQLVRFEPSAKNYLFRREILMQPRLSPMLTNGWAQRDLASAALAAQSSRTPPIDLVRVLSEQGKNAEAAEVDRQVLQANPRDVQAIDQLIFLDIEGKNYDEAIQLGEKLVVLQPERSATWDMVAWTYLRVDMTKTCAALEKARELGGSGVLNGEERCTNEEALPDALKPKPH
jgi:tetratricopeptide (TPR) repeat protein